MIHLEKVNESLKICSMDSGKEYKGRIGLGLIIAIPSAALKKKKTKNLFENEVNVLKN